MTPSHPLQSPDPLNAEPDQHSTGLDQADKIVLLCGIAAALLALLYQNVISQIDLARDQQWLLAFPLHWTWLLPLAVAMLADMRSTLRWVIAIAVYGIALPALSAYNLLPSAGMGPIGPPALLNADDLLPITLMMAALGFMCLPIIRAFDHTQPLCNYVHVFRAAWRTAVQGVLAGVLATCVLILLYLGAQLFATIGITFFDQLFETTTFWLIAIPVAFAIALVGVQRRPQLANVLQRSWLTLNGWMLPLASALGVTFTVALVVQLVFGLRADRLSTSVLIGFAAVWIKLVNATWQDGTGTPTFGPRLQRALRWSLYFLLPLAALALYNMFVRVDQYGWTVSRVWGAFAATLAVIYSVGYFIAAARSTRFHAILAGTNYTAAFLAIIVLVMSNTPILDPHRLTVDSQIQRLMDGRLALENFNFGLMKSDTGQYGRAALQRLAEGAANAQDPRIANFAKRSLAGEYIPTSSVPAGESARPVFTVHPAGRPVPPEWWREVDSRQLYEMTACRPDANQDKDEPARPSCALLFADLSGTGIENLILYVPKRGKHSAELFQVFKKNASGGWDRDGSLERVTQSDKVPAASGKDQLPDSQSSTISSDIANGAVRTAPRTDRDLVIGDVYLRR